MRMITRNLLTRSYKLLLTLLVLLMSTNAFAQRLTATGKVTDAAGLEVIGASVLEKGTANGVVTNLDGEFSLSVGQNATLVISFIGYKTIEVKATTNMNITLQEDNELLDEVVNKVWHLDAQLGQIDMYSLGWKAYLHQRVVDEERRRREREVAEKKADRLMKQGIRLHAKATKAVAAQNMMRRAEKLLENTSEAQKAEKVADIRFPEPAPCGRTPIMAKDISKAYGSNIVFAGVNLAIDKGSRVVILGYNGAGKTTTLRLLAHIEEPDTGSVEYGHGCKIGYFAQEHDTLDLNATVLENLQHVAPELDNTQARSILGSFLFSGDDAMKPAHVLSGGEKTRLALATLVTSRANVLLLDEPTNNLDPASREEILKAIAKYEGAIVLVTHDEGAVEALNPERVLLMPDGDEDLWNDSYLELVAEE